MKFSLRFSLFLLQLTWLTRVTTIGSKRRSRRGFELSSEDLELYTLNHDSIEDYDFTTPVYIEPESLVSKRSADSEPVTSREREVKFNAFGRVYHVRLEPNTWLVRQGLVAEYVAADGSVTEEPITSWDCHYFAHLISHVGESVGALSTCYGLRGVISHDDTDVYIAPLKDHHALRYRREIQDDLDGEHAHIVYKRTASQSGQRTSDTMSSAYDRNYDGHDDHDSIDDTDGAVYYTNDGTSDNDYGNDTYNNSTFCGTVYTPEYREEEADPPSEHLSSWDQGYEEWGNTSHPGPIFADRMAARQEDGEHKQEGGQRYIELFLLLDDTMKNFHKEDLMNYTLTFMNVISRRYAHRTLRSEIRLAVIKIVVAESHMLKMTGLNGYNYTLRIQPESRSLLYQFSHWQREFNPKSDEDPLHFDNAIFLSRRDLYIRYGNRREMGLLGKAYLGQICNTDDSCSVNEERGLESAITVTHELGHNLNLLHDGDYGCPNGKNIMSAYRVIGPSSYQWSHCSADELADFLESRTARRCLLDEPSTGHPQVQMLRVDELAGVTYSRLEQCRKAWGESVTELCDAERTYTGCQKVGCRRSGRCAYTDIQDGTSCGKDKWCFEGHCHSSLGGIPGPVNGGWSEWTGNFSICSRTCGTGVRYIRRRCNNPAPLFGGLACEGNMYVMETCNENPCPGINSSDDYRHRECALTNKLKLWGRYHQWKANLDDSIYGDKLCELKCHSNRGARRDRPPNKVSSGTQCWDDHEPNELRLIRRCVDGECKELGCDGVYGSGKILDGCHKCEGTGRTCQRVKGALRGREPVAKNSYWHWLTIPTGSTGVNITSTDRSNLALALKLDGHFVFQTSAGSRTNARRFTVGKTHIILRSFNYNYNKYEMIWILSGPTTKEIEIHVLNERSTPRSFMNAYRYPVLFYEWYKPISGNVSYYWETYPITNCSATCGGGNKTVTVTCIEDIDGARKEASDRFCNETKPAIYPECNTELCIEPQWRIGEWGSCSVTCDEGIEVRVVDCIDVLTMDILPTNDCIDEEGYQPNNTRPCHQLPCPTQGPTTSRPTETETTAAKTTAPKTTAPKTTASETTASETTASETTTSETTTPEKTTSEKTTSVKTTSVKTTSATTVSPSTVDFTVNMTTSDYVTMDLTTSRSPELEGSEPPPIISIPKDNACAKKCNNFNLLLCLIISILMASNKLSM